MSNRLTLILAATGAVAFYLPSAAHAQTTVSWIGATGNYVDPTQWSSGAVPTIAGDIDAVINNAGTALLSTGDSGEAAILTLGLQPGDSGNLSLSGGTLNLGDLNVAGRSLLFDNATPSGGGTGTFTQSGGIVNVTATASPSSTPRQSLYIANGGLATGNSATGTYVMTAGQLTIGVTGATTGSAMIVGSGAGSSGAFIQSGGTVTLNGSSSAGVGTLQIANAGSTGSYSLSNSASLSVTNGLNVGSGAGSVGSFAQSGGLVSDASNMNIAFAGGTGSYSLSAGSLSTTGFLYVGNGTGSVGSLSQTGGSLSTTGVLTLGNSGGTGNFSLSAGAVTINNVMNVGGTNSVFSMTGSSPSLTVKGSFLVGQLGSGSATLSSGSINIGTTTSQLFVIGNNAGDTGTFTQTGGSVTLSGSLRIGAAGSTSPNLYDMQAGSLSIGTDSYIGGFTSQTTGSGTFSQAAGTTVSTVGSISVGIGSANSTANGTYNLNGGTLNLTKSGAVLAIGNNGIGTFNQSGGTLTITTGNATVDVGRTASGNTGHGTYNLSGSGVLNTALLRTNNIPGDVINFSGGSSNIGTLTLTSGNMNVSAGTHTVTGATTIGTTTTTATVFISGGTLNFGTGITLGTGSTIRTSVNQTISAPISLGSGTFQVDSNTLTLTSPITIPSGGHSLTKTGTGTLNLNGSWIYNVTPGVPVITTSAGTTNLNVNLNGPTNIYSSPTATVNLNTPQTVKTVTSTGGTFVLAPGGTNTLIAGAIAISGGGSIDLTNNSLLLPSPIPANLITYLDTAYAGGTWTGPGLTSSTAAKRSDHTTGLGYSDNGSTVTVKYTYLGDLNLDGKINADDYALLDRQVAQNGLGSAATWTTGDFNYDGVVNSSDYMLIDTSFAHQSGTLSPTFLAQRESQFGDAYVQSLLTSVPEPTSLLTACGLALLPLRRRRHTK